MWECSSSRDFSRCSEVLLSYFSNTLSFVRIGAFAVSHAAMMGVVLMLYRSGKRGSPNWIAIVPGNLFVMGMEGLIVGIQVLRLEYYEMFSRFYKGDGKPFTPFLKKKNKLLNPSFWRSSIMTLTVEILLVIALVLSIIIPGGVFNR